MQQTIRETKTCTKALDPGAFVNELKNASISFLDACTNRKIFINKYGRSIDICDGLFLINYLAAKNDWPDIVRKVFLQCFLIAEDGVSSSGSFACFAFSKFLLKKPSIDIREISIHSRCIGEEIAFQTLDGLMGEVSELLTDTLRYVGTQGNITINTGTKTCSTLEIFSGHNFHIGIEPRFCVHQVKRATALTFFVDGAIERASEIHHLLEYCHSNKATCAIVARKFGDDVISTLNLNFKRKTLDVFPIIVNDKISQVNTFADLGIVTQSTVIEPLSGMTVTGFDPHEMKFVTNLRCTSTQMSFNAKPEAAHCVNERIKNLQTKVHKLLFSGLMEKTDVDVILRGRINSLTTNSATLWLPLYSDENDLHEFVSARFKFGLEMLDGFCKTGAIPTNIVKNVFKDLNTEFLPSNILINSLQTADNFVKSIDSIGGCLVVEKFN